MFLGWVFKEKDKLTVISRGPLRKFIFSLFQGAFTFHGSMIDMPLLKQAQNIVTLATAIKKKWAGKWSSHHGAPVAVLKDDYNTWGGRKLKTSSLSRNLFPFCKSVIVCLPELLTTETIPDSNHCSLLHGPCTTHSLQRSYITNCVTSW